MIDFLRNIIRIYKNIQRDKYSLAALIFLFMLLAVGAFSDFIANNQPIYADKNNNAIIPAPIPYAPDQPDPLNRDFTGPFDEQKFKTNDNKVVTSPLWHRHHLGTDAQGNDLLSGLIHGASVSLKIGFFSMLIAGIIGLILGSLAGYYGNDTICLTRGSLWMSIIGCVLGFFWAFVSRKDSLNQAVSAGFSAVLFQLLICIAIVFMSILLFNQAGKALRFIPFFRGITRLPLDNIFQGFAGIFSAVPYLILIIAFASFLHQKGTGTIILIIGMTSWTGVYRLTRIEIMKIKTLPYIEAARTYGMSDSSILVKHAIPNAFAPILVELTFLIPMAIIAESSLSFLGIGVPDWLITWGSLLNYGRQQFDAWWMVVFPGLAIMLTVMAFMILGEGIRKIHKKSV